MGENGSVHVREAVGDEGEGGVVVPVGSGVLVVAAEVVDGVGLAGLAEPSASPEEMSSYRLKRYKPPAPLAGPLQRAREVGTGRPAVHPGRIPDVHTSTNQITHQIIEVQIVESLVILRPQEPPPCGYLGRLLLIEAMTGDRGGQQLGSRQWGGERVERRSAKGLGMGIMKGLASGTASTLEQ